MAYFNRHSPIAQAAYNDLLSLLLDEAVTGIRGSPTLRTRGARKYWYDRYRIGDATKEHYLGEDTEALRARIETHAELAADAANRRRERSRLVRLLRSERFLGADGATGSLMAALAKSGAFRLGGVVVGTSAFRIYEGELGLKLQLDQTAQTRDIDIASFERLSLALATGETVAPELSTVFADFDFSPVQSLQAGQVWRWRQSPSQTLIEFLTPSFSEDEGIRPLAALGVNAQALHHLNYLIASPIDAAIVYREGVLVKAPRPERFAIHKLIVADRRREGPDSQKAQKDLMQAELVMSVLAEDRPADLIEAYNDAMQRGPRWRERLDRTLARSRVAREALEKAN